MRDGTVIVENATDEYPPPVQRQTGISVGHRGLLAVAELDNSTKSGGLTAEYT